MYSLVSAWLRVVLVGICRCTIGRCAASLSPLAASLGSRLWAVSAAANQESCGGERTGSQAAPGLPANQPGSQLSAQGFQGPSASSEYIITNKETQSSLFSMTKNIWSYHRVTIYWCSIRRAFIPSNQMTLKVYSTMENNFILIIKSYVSERKKKSDWLLRGCSTCFIMAQFIYLQVAVDISEMK